MKQIAVLYVFESVSSPDKVYQSLHYTDGTTSCDCSGWTRRCVGGVRTCRHVRLIESGCAERACKSRVDYSKRPTQPHPPATLPARKFDFSV